MARGRLRVVAGTVGGRRLEAPRGDAVRPTAERVREAVFASLGRAVHDVAVLDLYAGTGALAIEALSRGARAAVCVERDPRVAAVIDRNLEHTGFTGRARVVVGPVAGFLARTVPPEAPFGLVCADPPYDVATAEVEAALAALAADGWLAPGAVVVVERALADPPPHGPDGWEPATSRAYGDTLVHRLVVPGGDGVLPAP